MIYFINGEFQGSDILDIVHFDFDEFTEEDIWNKPLTEDCYVLEIKRQGDFDLFRAHEYGIYYIPREGELNETGHGIFYDSEETILFTHFEQALVYMKNYKGGYETEIKELYDEVIDSIDRDGAYFQLTNLNNFENEIDVDFLNELEEIVDYTDLSLDSILSTMKFLILNRYELRIKQQRLSLLN